MKQRKPRTKPQKIVHKCYSDPDECVYPWANRCGGEKHNCMRMRMRWLASLSEKEKKRQIEKMEAFKRPTTDGKDEKR